MGFIHTPTTMEKKKRRNGRYETNIKKILCVVGRNVNDWNLYQSFEKSAEMKRQQVKGFKNCDAGGGTHRHWEFFTHCSNTYELLVSFRYKKKKIFSSECNSFTLICWLLRVFFSSHFVLFLSSSIAIYFYDFNSFKFSL